MVFVNFLCQWNITIVSSHLVSKKVIYHRQKLLLTANIDDLINQELEMSSCKHTNLLDPEKYNNKIFPPLVPHADCAVSRTSHPHPPASVTNECEPFSIIIHASTSCCSPPPPATGARAWEGTPRLISQSSGAARNYEFREIFHCRPPILVGGALHWGRMKKVDHSHSPNIQETRS